VERSVELAAKLNGNFKRLIEIVKMGGEDKVLVFYIPSLLKSDFSLGPNSFGHFAFQKNYFELERVLFLFLFNTSKWIITRKLLIRALLTSSQLNCLYEGTTIEMLMTVFFMELFPKDPPR
jgi:hypothetical protein